MLLIILISTDFDVHGGLSTSFGVLNNWESIMGNASTIDTGFIVLEHDLFEESVQLATGYILPSAMERKLDIKPVISCLNKPLSDAYIETNDNKTNPPLSGLCLSTLLCLRSLLTRQLRC